MRKQLMKHYRIMACSVLAMAAPLQSANADDVISRPPVPQHYLVTTQVFGTVRYFRLDLERQGEKLGGRWNGNSLDGITSNNSLSFIAKDKFGGSERVQ